MKINKGAALLCIALGMIVGNLCFADPTLLGSMTGEAVYDEFGFAVSASVCDFNYVLETHWGDVVVGAHHAHTDIGESYVYFGANPFNTSIDLYLNGPSGGSVYDYFGYALSGHLNLNGDAHSDIAVGAPGRNYSKGEAYIYYGGSSMNNGIDVTLSGAADYDEFGAAINNTYCNVDNNSYGDVVVGAPYANGDIGRAYVFYGGNPMNNVADVTLSGESANDEFGFSISCGNVNGDSYSDIVVGAPGRNGSQGKVYIFYGGNPMNNVADITYTGVSTGDRFGASVCLREKCLIVGAPGYNSSTGKIYIDSTCDGTWDITKTGESTYNSFGASVYLAYLGSSGSEYDAFLVGAPDYSSSTGRVYTYKRYNGALYWTLTGEATYDSFGTSINCGHDVNRVSRCSPADDIIIGAPGYSSSTGKAYVYDGVTFHPPKEGDGGSQSVGYNDVSTALKVKPNPFKERLSITFNGTKGSDYRLRLFDVSGRIVKTINGHMCNNTETLIWDRRDERGEMVGAGIYLYQYECGRETASGVVVAR